jgi:hypothetical protein
MYKYALPLGQSQQSSGKLLLPILKGFRQVLALHISCRFLHMVSSGFWVSINMGASPFSHKRFFLKSVEIRKLFQKSSFKKFS